MPTDPIPELTPDLTVEVLSQSNTPAEMQRKQEEYFAAGVRLVWMVDLERRTIEASSSPSTSAILSGSQALDGADVLPGFTLPLPELFAALDRKAG